MADAGGDVRAQQVRARGQQVAGQGLAGLQEPHARAAVERRDVGGGARAPGTGRRAAGSRGRRQQPPDPAHHQVRVQDAAALEAQQVVLADGLGGRSRDRRRGARGSAAPASRGSGASMRTRSRPVEGGPEAGSRCGGSPVPRARGAR